MRTSLLVSALLLVAACESSPPAMIKTFSDSGGHACMTDLNDISSAATCDVDPGTIVMGCSGGSVPAFTLTPYYMDPYQLRNCGSCRNPSTMMTTIVPTACSTVTCTTAADCVYANATCDAGMCHCPDGFCN